MRPILLTIIVLGMSPSAFCFSQDKACAEYTIGESHAFTVTHLPKAPNHYSVVRDSETAYSVYINIDFLGDQKIKTKVESCLADTNKIGLSSDARNIFLRLYEEGVSPGIAPRKTLIKVHEKYTRANSQNFPINFDCSSIVHELLHTAGLDDEYEEESTYISKVLPIKRDAKSGEEKSAAPAYDCRSRSDSIMADTYSYDPSKPKFSYSIDKVCACPKSVGSQSCNDAMKNYMASVAQTPQLACPVGMEQGILKTYELSPPAGKSSDDYSFFAGLPSVMVRHYPIRAGEIRRILWPHCKSNNVLYDQCVSNAYQTSKKNGGSGCYKVPEACGQLNTWLD